MIVMLERGLDVSKVITKEIPANKYKEGFNTMLAGGSGKIIMDWEQ